MEDPRHRCRGCGASCTGVGVRPVDDAERAAIEASARRLGVARPLVDGRLRLVFGRCVFLDADHRCRLHLTGGPEAKPRVCRQFPFVAVEREGVRRVGVDPGCLHGLMSGGVPPTEALLAATVEADPATEALLAGAGSLGEVAARVGWSVADARAWAAGVPWFALADGATLGPLLRDAARQLGEAAFLAGPDAWPRSAHEAALLDGMERMVGLRLLPLRGPDAVRHLLGGVRVAVCARPDDPRRLASAWFRLARVWP